MASSKKVTVNGLGYVGSSLAVKPERHHVRSRGLHQAPPNRRVFLGLLAAAPLLAACGFEPLHAQRGAVAALPPIRIDPIPDRPGQILRNYLLDRLAPLGEGGAQAHTLVVRLFEPRQVLALRRDDVISRMGYSAVASYELLDAVGKRVVAGSSNYSTDYEITNSEFATLAAQQNARERVLELVADDIRNQIAVQLRAQDRPRQ
jgi:LPS-assembly lipoprotein